jgi:hypothetical protein
VFGYLENAKGHNSLSKAGLSPFFLLLLPGKAKCPVAGCGKSLSKKDIARDRSLENELKRYFSPPQCLLLTVFFLAFVRAKRARREPDSADDDDDEVEVDFTQS